MFIAVLLAAVVGAGLAVCLVGLYRVFGPASAMEVRAQRFAGRTLAEEELQAPFFDRTIRPLMARVGQRLEARRETSRRDVIRRKLWVAGKPYGLTSEGFLAAKAVIGLGVFVLLTLLFLVIGLQLFFFGTILSAILAGAGAGGLGYLFPDLWLRDQVKQRRNRIRRGLAEVLDTLTVIATAGLSLQESILTLVEEEREERANGVAAGSARDLIDELDVIMAQVRLGSPLVDSLEALAARMEVEELSRFTAALRQSLKTGTPVAELLAMQAQDIRDRAFRHAMKQAKRATVKMLFPMVGCIFPTILIVLMAPALLIIMHQSH